METVGGGVRTHVLQLLKNLDPERYELTLIYGERYDHVFESQREELAKHVPLILDSNLVRSAGLRASWKAVKSLRATLRRIKPDIVHVFAAGHFVKTGGPELADELEEFGYDAYLPEGADSESALA